MKSLAYTLSVLILGVSMALGDPSGEEGVASIASQAKPKSAIFVQNRAKASLNIEIDAFRDLVAAKLDQAGFAVMDHEEVIRKFRKFKDDTESDEKDGVEQSISGASALRLAQMLRADYIIIVNMLSLDKISRTTKVYGVDRSVQIFKMATSIKVLEGYEGQSIYGNVVESQTAASPVESSGTADSAYHHRVMLDAASKIAESVSSEIDKIRNTIVKATPMVQFTVESNVDNVSVALDGAVIGTAPGKFMAAPGIHQMRLTRQWMEDWERSVNIVPNQVLAVQMEMSNEGLSKFKSLESFKAAIENERMIAEGQKKLLENSHIKFEGDIDTLSIGNDASPNAVEVINNIVKP
jgi:hypothetical protein